MGSFDIFLYFISGMLRCESDKTSFYSKYKEVSDERLTLFTLILNTLIFNYIKISLKNPTKTILKYIYHSKMIVKCWFLLVSFFCVSFCKLIIIQSIPFIHSQHYRHSTLGSMLIRIRVTFIKVAILNISYLHSPVCLPPSIQYEIQFLST